MVGLVRIRIPRLQPGECQATSTPLFANGLEAALHGMKAIRRPAPKAKRTMRQLAAKKARRG
jgi:hypothetical protein